jgi:sulfane dehydrogenase subunit SoxC
MDEDQKERTPAVSRREVVAGAALFAGGVLIDALPSPQGRQGPAPAVPPATALTIPDDPTKAPGPPTSALSSRSPFVTPARTPVGVISGASLTPLHELTGTITPNDLQFERHHAGVAMIDPAKYHLLVHGMVERSIVFTLDDLRALPSVTRVHFLECSGNGRSAFRAPRADLTPQQIDGMFSNVEWTGVRMVTLLDEVGVRSDATWVLAEGGDAALLSRSIPLEKLQDDALIAYAQNGEPLRPSGGYPARLLLPGWEGNTCVKWLRRLELIAKPNMSRDETSRYTDPLANGTARQFSFVMDVKSTITYPTSPVRLTRRGWTQVSGLAWSGRGRVARVDVSTDGGRTWTEAVLETTPTSKAAVRFTHLWNWNGGPATIMSRATDETGAVQPRLAEFRATRGAGTDYHYNYVRVWQVAADGQITFVHDA